MDWNELISDINKWKTVVSSWFRNIGKLYFSETPENVTVEMIDEDGNLATSTLPNVAQFRKTVWDDVGGAIGQFSKTFYIDGINGNDANGGTLSRPFKTIMKAINSSPIGAEIYIYLIGSSDVNDRVTYSFGNNGSSSIVNKIKNKKIHINSYNRSYSKIKPDVYKSSTTNFVKGLILENSFVGVLTNGECIVVEGGDIDMSLATSWIQAGVFNYYTSNNAVCIGGYPVETGIICTTGQSSIINICSRDTESVLGSVLFRLTKIKQDYRNPNRVINLYGGVPAVINLYSVVISDQYGSVLPHNEIVSGITVDVDSGNPINIISNLNFSN